MRKRGMVHRLHVVRDEPVHHHIGTLDNDLGQMGEDQEDGSRGDKEDTAKGKAVKAKYPRKPNKGKSDKYYVN